MKLSLVVPVFNEQEAIPLFYEAVTQNDSLKEYELEFVFINDGSCDNTSAVLHSLPQPASQPASPQYPFN